MNPKLTYSGQEAMLKALNGDEICFTKIKLGNGPKPDDYAQLTDLQNPLKSISIEQAVIENHYAKLTGETVSNADFESDFYWTELGIFVSDPEGGPDDLLYAYAHYELSEDAAPLYIGASTSSVVQITPIVHVYVGDAENITAELSEASDYALKSELNAHKSDSTNPHGVTKAQVGLSNVPNVTTNNQTPTFSAASSLAEINSGEKMSTIMGKIKKAIAALVSHIGNKSNPHSVTLSQVGAAAASHSHNASAITAGTLGTARGGTGLSSVVANRLFYAAGASKFGQVAQSPINGYALFQNANGAPYWGAVCEVGTYTGQGKSGSGSPNSITFRNCRPKLIYIQQNGYARFGIMVIFGGVSQGISFVDGVCSRLIVSQTQSGDDTTVSWYYPSSDSHSANQLDHSGQQYVYAAVK